MALVVNGETIDDAVTGRRSTSPARGTKRWWMDSTR